MRPDGASETTIRGKRVIGRGPDGERSLEGRGGVRGFPPRPSTRVRKRWTSVTRGRTGDDVGGRPSSRCSGVESRRGCEIRRKNSTCVQKGGGVSGTLGLSLQDKEKTENRLVSTVMEYGRGP